MGYWNGWGNFAEWCWWNDYTRICLHCNNTFMPVSGNQKYCNNENNPACESDRYFQKLWNKGKHPLQLEGKLIKWQNNKATITKILWWIYSTTVSGDALFIEAVLSQETLVNHINAMDEDKRSCFSCKYYKICVVRITVYDSTSKIKMNINSDDVLGKWLDIFDAIGNCCLEYENIDKK